MGYFNIDTFDRMFMFTCFNASYNADLYSNWPTSGTESISNFNNNTTAIGTLFPHNNTYVYNSEDVQIYSPSNGYDRITILGHEYTFSNGGTAQKRMFIIMNDTSKGFRIGCYYIDNYVRVQMSNRINNINEYNALLGALPPAYVWQSVPSISGKNGILSLVTLDSEAINDGEAVTGADISVFDQAPSTDNNVKDLADTYGSGEESSAVDVTVKYKVTLPPGGAFSVLKLVAKKDSIPEDATDGDKIVDISPTKTKKTVTGLDENSMYYFKIFAEDSNSNTSESDEKHILTSGDEGYNFDYTGEIVEWTVPKTGIYSLETWGAQGGNATDGTNSARGGYGAYAYGEVLLNQGDTLYINVGGQNGYGGGGGYVPPEYEYDFWNFRHNDNFTNRIDIQASNAIQTQTAIQHYLDGMDIMGTPNTSYLTNIGLSNDVLTITGKGQVDYYFALDRINYEEFKISVDITSSNSADWTVVAPWYIDSSNVGHEVRKDGDFSFLGTTKHFEFTYDKSELPTCDYIHIAFGNNNDSNFAITVSNFVVTLVG